MKKILLATLLLASLTSPLHAQEEKALYKEIEAMDKTLFDAFNREDADAMSGLFSPDLEFFHDTGGVNNYEQNLQAFRTLFARHMHLHRELVPASMQVYPVKDYGAIQTGEHQFCHIENGKNDCAIFKFLHIWKRDASGWKLARIVSYGH
jgi:ketosteroid isomerase-like protein